MDVATLRLSFERLYARLPSGGRHHDWFRTTRSDDGSPHVERRGDEWCYVVTERGVELERRCTGDVDRLLYWLLAFVTTDMALAYARADRRPNEDFRRRYFRRQEELLRSLDPEWGDEYRRERERILAEHPFDDTEGR